MNSRSYTAWKAGVSLALTMSGVSGVFASEADGLGGLAGIGRRAVTA
jgi:hypothetical protein